jgi:hypothetical protein
MRATLHIQTGAYAGRKIALRDGEVAQFGRTEWSDYSFPTDAAMADRHFQVQCAPRQCALQDLQTPAGTLVDGREVKQHVLQTGNVITAGTTSFLVVLGDDPLPVAPAAKGTARAAAVSNEEAAPVELPKYDLVALAKIAKLGKPAVAVAKESPTIEACVQSLLDQKLVDEALGLVAVALPPRAAVEWAVTQMRGTLSAAKIELDAPNEAALQLAEQWLAEPSDELARECDRVANELELDTPAAWASFAAYFGQNNLAQPGADPIVPGPGVCGNSARCCLLLTSALLPVAEKMEARRGYIAAASLV